MPPSPPRLQSHGRQVTLLRCNQRTRLLGLLVCCPLAFIAITTFWGRGSHPLRPDGLHLLHHPAAHSGGAEEAGGQGGRGGTPGSASSSRGERSGVRRLISSDSWQQQQQHQWGRAGGGGSAERRWQQPERGPPGAAAPAPRVWLYTLVGADYEGSSALLPHWLRHYLVALQFPAHRLLVVVNTNSSRGAEAGAGGELARVEGVLQEWGVRYTLWRGRYSSDAHLKASAPPRAAGPPHRPLSAAVREEEKEEEGGPAGWECSVAASGAVQCGAVR